MTTTPHTMAMVWLGFKVVGSLGLVFALWAIRSDETRRVAVASALALSLAAPAVLSATATEPTVTPQLAAGDPCNYATGILWWFIGCAF